MPEKITILIVDDDRGGRESLEALLLTQGYSLILSSNGPDALQKISEKNPDLVLLDVMMPGMDGYEVCRRIRSTPQIADIPVLMLTALGDYRSRLAGLEAGADDFITKPYDSVELFARVRTVSQLNRYRRLLIERVKFQQLFDRSPTGQALMDSSGRITLANDTLARLVNIADPDELAGQVFIDWVSVERRESVQGVLETIWKESRQQRIETWLAGYENMLQPVELILSPISLGEENLIHLIAIDIREKLKITGALAKERNILKAVLEISTDYIYCKDLESKYMLSNTALASLMGVSTTEEMVGKTDFDYLPREIAVRIFSDERALFETGRPIADQEETLVDYQGERHLVVTNKMLLSNHRGQVIGLVGFSRDISALKAVQGELDAKKNELKEARRKYLEMALQVETETNEAALFISAAESEISPSLQEMARQLELLSKANGQADLPGSMLSIAQNVFKVRTTLSDLYDYARWKIGSLEFVEEQFSLEECINGSIRWTRQQAEKRGLSIVVELQPAIPASLWGDHRRLQKILFNLFTSAIGMAKSGEIMLRVELENYVSQPAQKGIYLHLAVRFQGEAVIRQNENRVFDLAFQKKEKDIITNTFGLAVSKRLSQAAGGAVWAEDVSTDRVNQTVFHLSYPVVIKNEPNIR